MAQMHVGRTAAVALLGLYLSTPARAESEDVVLEYQAFAGCPDRARFEAEVRALSARARFVEALPGARRFRVRLWRAAGGVQGTLNISASSGDTERQVSGKTCNEVASALALATAIAVDPTVLGETSEPSPKPKPKPAAPKPKPKPPAAGGAPDVDRAPERPVSEPDRVLIGIGGGLERAVAPAVASRFSLRVGWQPAGRWAPLVFVEGGYLPPVTTDFAEFSDLFALRSGASLRLFESSPWSVGPELAFEVGNVKAAGNAAVVSNPRVEQMLSTAGVLAAFLRLSITRHFCSSFRGERWSRSCVATTVIGRNHRSLSPSWSTRRRRWGFLPASERLFFCDQPGLPRK